MLGLLSLTGLHSTVFGQGSETFESQTSLGTGYADGNFNGETSGVVVRYVHSRNEGLGTTDNYSITGKGIILRRSDEPSSVEFVIPSGGVGTFSFQYRKAFTGAPARTISVYVDGVEVSALASFGNSSGADNTIYTANVPVNKEGGATVKISYTAGTSNGNKQFTVDNVNWTGYTETVTEAPSIQSQTFTAKVGVPFEGTVENTGGKVATWEQWGTLPEGISFDLGVFSGTPLQAGTLEVGVSAENEVGESSTSMIFQIAKGDHTSTLTSSYSGYVGQTITLPTSTDQGFPIQYSITGSNVTLNGGNLSLNSVGNATITATAVDNNENYENYELTFNVNVTAEPEIYNGVGVFEKVNSLEELTSGYYVVTYEDANHAMNNNGTSYLNVTNISVDNNKINNPSTNIVWKLDVNNTSTTFYNEDVEKYLTGSAGSNSNISLSSDLNSNHQHWNTSFSGGFFTFTNSANTSRKLGYNTSASPRRFAQYQGSNQQPITLTVYKLIVNNNTSVTYENGSWSGTPSISTDVLIKGQLELTENLEAKSLTISDAGGQLTVPATVTLTVDGAIDNQAGLTGLVIKDGGYLIQNQDVENLGSITVEKESQAMVRNDMTFWSSPVQQADWQQTIRSFSPETLFNRFWTYNETTNEFAQILTSDSDNQTFEAGKGVSIRVRNTLPTGQTTTHLGVFNGVPFNGNVSVPVQFTTDGYNLVGNPYASNLDVAAFLDANLNVNSLYFWTHQYPVGSANYGNNYAAFTLAGGTIEDISNIAVGQGFIVGLSQTTANVEFTNAMRTSADAYFYKGSSIERNRIWLSLNNNDQKVNQILLAYMTGATNEVDSQIDAKMIDKNGSVLYNIVNQEAYAIQGRALPFADTDVVALGFKALEQGEFTINVEKVDGLFADGQKVYLKDNALNIVHDLATAYTFTSEAGQFDTRFEVIYADKTLGNNNLTKNKDVVVYTNNGEIVIESKQSTIVSVELYDVQGRKVVSKSNINKNIFNVNTATKGVLVVKVLTKDGQSFTQKVVNK